MAKAESCANSSHWLHLHQDGCVNVHLGWLSNGHFQLALLTKLDVVHDNLDKWKLHFGAVCICDGNANQAKTHAECSRNTCRMPQWMTTKIICQLTVQQRSKDKTASGLGMQSKVVWPLGRRKGKTKSLLGLPHPWPAGAMAVELLLCARGHCVWIIYEMINKISTKMD